MTSSSPYSEQMRPFAEKMKSAGLAEFVVQTFSYYFEKVKKGETGLIYEKNIQPLLSEEVWGLEELEEFEKKGKKCRSQAVYITLNGGLGTSMGLTKAKSLLRAKFGRSFLEIILDRAYSQGVSQVLMNSFSTDADTRAEVDRIQPEDLPEIFLQHKFPKIMADTLAPANWPLDRELEWNPAGSRRHLRGPAHLRHAGPAHRPRGALRLYLQLRQPGGIFELSPFGLFCRKRVSLHDGGGPPVSQRHQGRAFGQT